MAKFYVESGAVKLVLSARNAREAAIKAFEWTCQKQATIRATTPLEHVAEAERRGWQLDEFVSVSQRGFSGLDARVFDTVQIVQYWHGVVRAADSVI